MQDADAVQRDFEHVGGDLREDRFDALADGGGSDIDRYRAIHLDRHFRVFARPRTTPFDEAADTQTMVAAIDQPPLQGEFFGPARFTQALIEGAGIVAAVARGHAEPVIGLQIGELVRHLLHADEIAPANRKRIDPHFGCRDNPASARRRSTPRNGPVPDRSRTAPCC